MRNKMTLKLEKMLTSAMQCLTQAGAVMSVLFVTICGNLYNINKIDSADSTYVQCGTGQQPACIISSFI